MNKSKDNKSKKAKPTITEKVKVEVQTVREYTKDKLSGDIGKYVKLVEKFEESINNHTEELQEKQKKLKEAKKILDQLKLIDSNCNLITV